MDILYNSIFEAVKEMMVDWTFEDQLFFSNMAKLHQQFTDFNNAVADGSSDMKENISKLFEILKSVS